MSSARDREAAYADPICEFTRWGPPCLAGQYRNTVSARRQGLCESLCLYLGAANERSILSDDHQDAQHLPPIRVQIREHKAPLGLTVRLEFDYVTRRKDMQTLTTMAFVCDDAHLATAIALKDDEAKDGLELAGQTRIERSSGRLDRRWLLREMIVNQLVGPKDRVQRHTPI